MCSSAGAAKLLTGCRSDRGQDRRRLGGMVASAMQRKALGFESYARPTNRLIPPNIAIVLASPAASPFYGRFLHMLSYCILPGGAMEDHAADQFCSRDPERTTSAHATATEPFVDERQGDQLLIKRLEGRCQNNRFVSYSQLNTLLLEKLQVQYAARYVVAPSWLTLYILGQFLNGIGSNRIKSKTAM